MKSTFTTIASASLLIVSLSIAFYLIIYLPKRNAYLDSIKEQESSARKQGETVQLRQRAIKECEDALRAVGEVISKQNDATMAKQYVDGYSNFRERCIQNKINEWSGGNN